MATSIYKINRGINQSIEFKGLKAQYIWYLGGGLVGLLVVFAAMYIIGLPTYLCVGTIATAGPLIVVRVYSMSKKYGEHGLMKKLARRKLPSAIRWRSRQPFFQLKKD